MVLDANARHLRTMSSVGSIAGGLPQLFVTLVIWLCWPPREAVGQEIPVYDTEAFCEQRAGDNAPNNRRFASCLMIEEYALAELEDYWPEATETMRVECMEGASTAESYVALASCVMFRVRQQRRHRE